MNLTVLIVGGYGTFGGRLVELLEGEGDLSLIVSGRSLKKAECYCKERGNTKAVLLAAEFDRNGQLSNQLLSLKPDILVDASGPFQSYGDSRYKLLEACIEQKINYLDLADGSEFVNGIGKFYDAARAAGVFILSGVSSFPVLTVLVTKELSNGIQTIKTIKGGIAPSPYAGVGGNVIRAIASYAGQSTVIKKDGHVVDAYPLTSTMRYTIAPPGYLPLKNTLFSLVDVPDLRVLPDIFPGVETVWMGAGPVPEILHRLLIGLSWFVRWKLIPSLSPLAKLMQFVMKHVRWGEHRGGMFVEVNGKDENGIDVTKSWHLLAEGSDGPLIPCMAIEAIIRKVLKGEAISSGARTAINDVSLDDYNNIFSNRTIYTGFREDTSQLSPHLFARILGGSWASLAPEIQAMHSSKSASEAEGIAVIERGNGFLANLAANILGLPEAGRDVPVNVKFETKKGKEIWTRTFAGKSFSSLQFEGKNRSQGLLMESFGPLTFGIALIPESGDTLRLVLRQWSFFGINLPLLFGPRSNSYEQVKDGKFTFNIDISYPLIGKIVNYSGWLTHKG